MPRVSKTRNILWALLMIVSSTAYAGDVPMHWTAQRTAMVIAEDNGMLTGTVEEVNRDKLTVTILTDSGNLVSLSAIAADVIASLKTGDRVQIEIQMEDGTEEAPEGETKGFDSPPKADI
jgi:cold shock CspA family protein